MSESTAASSRPDPPLYDEENGDKQIAKDIAMSTVADSRRGKRLRNGILLANLVVWLIVLALAKWLIF